MFSLNIKTLEVEFKRKIHIVDEAVVESRPNHIVPGSVVNQSLNIWSGLRS